jgi:hypothetical protein
LAFLLDVKERVEAELREDLPGGHRTLRKRPPVTAALSA